MLSPFVLDVAMHIIRMRYTWRDAQAQIVQRRVDTKARSRDSAYSRGC